MNTMNWMSAAVLSIAGLAAGCSVVPTGIDAAHLPPPYEITVPGKARSQGYHVTAGSDQAELIAKWLDANKWGWTPSVVTYVPQRVIRGESFDLNFCEDRCVLTTRDGQFTKKADASVLAPIFEK